MLPAAYEVAFAVENRTPCAEGLDRSGALAHSLLSTHPILRVSGGRFSSPLERPCGSVNTFPVLASATDDAVVGAAIVLPDHPQLAPESRGGLFDSTEIEEALLLHVKALSDGEREEIERQDPLVREMVARAAAATPEEVLALHGRVTLGSWRDPTRTPRPGTPGPRRSAGRRGARRRDTVRNPVATPRPRSRGTSSIRRPARSTPRSRVCAFAVAAR